MNQNNFSYNKDQLIYTGFGPNVNMPEDQWLAMVKDLNVKMSSGVEKFTLEHTAQYGNDATTTLLEFNKSKTSDFYFFNAFQIHAELNHKQKAHTQKFDLRTFPNSAGQGKNQKNRNITHKESYNLLAGRSVCKQFINEKTGGAYDVWHLVNFNKTNKNGDYELTKLYPGKDYSFQFDKELAKYPIKDLESDVSRAHLYDSLKRGNLQAVVMVVNGEEKLYHIEADARNKTFNVFDDQGKVLTNDQHRDLLHVVKNSTYTKKDFETQVDTAQTSQAVSAEGKKKKEILYLNAKGEDKRKIGRNKAIKA